MPVLDFIFVLGIVAASVAYLVLRWLKHSRSGGGGCVSSGCTSCSKPPVKIVAKK